MAKSEREPRSMPRLLRKLAELGDSITELKIHVEAACYTVGLPSVWEEPDIKLKPKDENVSPMEAAITKIRALHGLVNRLNSAFRDALQELVPDFYDKKMEGKTERP